MRNGMNRTFRVTAIDGGWLIGESTSVYAGDLARIQVRPKSVERAMWVSGVLMLVGASACLIPYPPVFTL
jgi:dihydrodipicolinate reductase